jgi:hypothetical protein
LPCPAPRARDFARSTPRACDSIPFQAASADPLTDATRGWAPYKCWAMGWALFPWIEAGRAAVESEPWWRRENIGPSRILPAPRQMRSRSQAITRAKSRVPAIWPVWPGYRGRKICWADPISRLSRVSWGSTVSRGDQRPPRGIRRGGAKPVPAHPAGGPRAVDLRRRFARTRDVGTAAARVSSDRARSRHRGRHAVAIGLRCVSSRAARHPDD